MAIFVEEIGAIRATAPARRARSPIVHAGLATITLGGAGRHHESELLPIRVSAATDDPDDDGAARDDERDAAQDLEAQTRDRPGTPVSTADAGDESGDGPLSSIEDLNTFLQIDGDNGFNRLLLMRRPGPAPYVLLSKEVVTQGCPLDGIALLPMVELLREAEPDLLQPWYADDGSGYGKLVRQRNVYKRLEQIIEPDFGYFPAGAKCWLTIPKRMEEEVKQYLADNGLPWQVTQGKRYVRGFIGSEDALSERIEPKVEHWTFAIERLANAA
ncbi:hypothetical protein THAOC_29600, partial [Thalassiosira oceanica]